MKKIAVLTSGGDAPGMNAAITAISRACSYHSIILVGIEEGFKGLTENKIIPLPLKKTEHIIKEGGTILKTSRYADFSSPSKLQIAAKNLVQADIDGIIVIGGNGSMAGACNLSDHYAGCILGLPASIDNDIFGTDFTIGFDTALNTVVSAIDKIRDTSLSHNQLFLIEVMGRKSGAIAVNAAIAGAADAVISPEKKSSTEHLINILRKRHKSQRQPHIVVVAEGALMKTRKSELHHTAGIDTLADRIKKAMPALDPRVVILGHLQRGGSPSCFDRVLACRLGIESVEKILACVSDRMIGIENNQIVQIPLSQTNNRKDMPEKSIHTMVNIMFT